MKLKILTLTAAVAALGFVVPQQTPKSTAAAYGALADTILAVKRTESEFVRSLLAHHFRVARDFVARADSEHAAAEIALFANEGDNAIGGVRKRLLEGGHHHNADGEAKGVYEPGFVIVTRKAKEEALAVSATMRTAKTEADRKAAWERFAAIANPLVHEE
jgi:hypothetical protein